jgi:hypothetical protein
MFFYFGLSGAIISRATGHVAGIAFFYEWTAVLADLAKTD